MFLIDRFQQFHGEVLRLRARATEGTWVFQGSGTVGGGDPSTTVESPSSIWKKLVTILERQALDAGREGGDFAVEVYRRAEYAMAALADEIFINLDWIGRDTWREHLLEMKLFGTHRAGDLLFERIEELLRDRDSVYSELARIYLMVLALGFQGKFRGATDADRQIENYRRRLFRFINGRDPLACRGDEALVPQAYQSTADERAQHSELPYLRPWLLVTALLLTIWIGGSYAIWEHAKREIEPLVNEIVTTRPIVPVAGGQ